MTDIPDEDLGGGLRLARAQGLLNVDDHTAPAHAPTPVRAVVGVPMGHVAHGLQPVRNDP